MRSDVHTHSAIEHMAVKHSLSVVWDATGALSRLHPRCWVQSTNYLAAPRPPGVVYAATNGTELALHAIIVEQIMETNRSCKLGFGC